MAEEQVGKKRNVKILSRQAKQVHIIFLPHGHSGREYSPLQSAKVVGEEGGGQGVQQKIKITTMSIFIVPSDTFPDELHNCYVIKIIPQLQQISVSINKMDRTG